MKQNNQLQKSFATASLALALTCATGLAATDIIPTPGAMQPGGDPFDTTLRYGQWWTGNGVSSQTFDTTKQSLGNIPGSIHVVFDAPGGTVAPPASANCAFGNFLNASGDNGWLGAGAAYDIAGYESLTFDMYVDPTLNSNLTAISMFLYGADYANVWLADVPITTAGWRNVVLPIPSTAVLPNCTAYGPYQWYNTDASTPPCHIEYWFDNVKLVARAVVLPPPALSVSPVTGTRLFLGSGVADGGGARQGIYTLSEVPWIGQASTANPVTYSFTISSIPNPAVYSNFQAQIFVVASTPNGTAAADWNFSDMGFLQVVDNSDGTATARLMWKTNDAYNNFMLWNEQFGGEYGTNGYAAGTLGFVNATNMLGTWSLSFTSDTNVTVSGPGGTADFVIPPEWIASFTAAGSGAMYAAFGMQPNAGLNAGQSVCFSRVKVTGGSPAYAIDDDFTVPPLNTNYWGKAASDASAVGVVPTNAVYWVNWNLPANGFDLITTATVGDTNSWVSLTAPSAPLPTPITVFSWDATNRVPVPANDLANPNQAFFAMVKRLATQLQVLLPGETNAPGTGSGKIGTPLPQTANVPFDLTVNACDASWHIASSCSDTVEITSSDASAGLVPNNALVNGTATISGYFYFGSSGTWTVTATDVTTNAVSPGTSTPITIP